MKARYFLSLILILLSLLLLPKISYLGSTRSNTDVTLQQVSTLGILGPNSDPNPVVNEGRQIQLSVTNSAGQIQTGFTFESGSPDIAQVDPQTGIVSGRQRGFVTITARRGSDTISNFVVVA
ncbi:MAG: Ig-like domain-containing protein, partial [Blastocatellia bacterium]|nr:Ig-like domain-containing protein [Blastocatellia bacterium]